MAPITTNNTYSNKTYFTAVEESEIDFSTASFGLIEAWIGFRGRDKGRIQAWEYSVERTYINFDELVEIKINFSAVAYCPESSKSYGKPLYKNIYKSYTYTNY